MNNLYGWLLVLILVLLWLFLVQLAEATVYVHHSATPYQPVDVGFQFSTPVALANTLQTAVAGPVAIVVASAFAVVLVAGLVLPHFGLVPYVRAKRNAGTTDHQDQPEPPASWYEVLDHLDMRQAFEYMGDSDDACQRKVICLVHKLLPSAPYWLQTIYRILSMNMNGVENFKEDIIHGLGGDDCNQLYPACPDSLWQLFIRTEPVRRLMELRSRVRFTNEINEF